MNIGEAIKKLRKEANITQSELASRAGITQTYLSQVEGDLKTVSPGTVVDIASALNVAVAVVYLTAITEADILRSDRTDPSITILFKTGKDLLLNIL